MSRRWVGIRKSICRIEASNLPESSSRLWSAGSASKQISCVETLIPGDNVKPGIDWSKPDFAIELVDHHLSLSILTIKLCWQIVAVKQPNSTWWSVAWFSGMLTRQPFRSPQDDFMFSNGDRQEAHPVPSWGLSVVQFQGFDGKLFFVGRPFLYKYHINQIYL